MTGIYTLYLRETSNIRKGPWEKGTSAKDTEPCQFPSEVSAE